MTHKVFPSQDFGVPSWDVVVVCVCVCFFFSLLFGWAHVKMFASQPETFFTPGSFPVFCTFFPSCLCVQQKWQEMFCWQMRREECCVCFSHSGSAHCFFFLFFIFTLFVVVFYLFIHESRFHLPPCCKLKPREPQTLSDCLLSYGFTPRFARQSVILQEGSIDSLEFPFWNTSVLLAAAESVRSNA